VVARAQEPRCTNYSKKSLPGRRGNVCCMDLCVVRYLRMSCCLHLSCLIQQQFLQFSRGLLPCSKHPFLCRDGDLTDCVAVQ
jgi:hypothetical protein